MKTKPDTTTWYRIGGYVEPIALVEVVSITDKSVSFWNEYRSRVTRSMSRNEFYPTWAEARTEVIRRAGQRLGNALSELKYAEQRIQNALAIPAEKPV